MTPFGLFRKKEKDTAEKKKETAKAKQPTQKTLLDELSGGDRELHEALSRTLLLNPETVVKDGADFYVNKAQEHEEAQNFRNARIAYQVAGEIALHEGKMVQMQKFFKKAAEVDPECPYREVFEYLSKKENAERALALAKEFYTKMRKRTEA
jgi:hypothetical protein